MYLYKKRKMLQGRTNIINIILYFKNDRENLVIIVLTYSKFQILLENLQQFVENSDFNKRLKKIIVFIETELLSDKNAFKNALLHNAYIK